MAKHDGIDILLVQVAGFLRRAVERDDKVDDLSEMGRLDVDRAYWRALDALTLRRYGKYNGQLSEAERGEIERECR
jgi:hypothetical protein